MKRFLLVLLLLSGGGTCLYHGTRIHLRLQSDLEESGFSHFAVAFSSERRRTIILYRWCQVILLVTGTAMCTAAIGVALRPSASTPSTTANKPLKKKPKRQRK